MCGDAHAREQPKANINTPGCSPSQTATGDRQQPNGGTHIQKTGAPPPPYDNLSKRLGHIDFTQHNAHMHPEAPPHKQNTPNDIAQHLAQLDGRGRFRNYCRRGHSGRAKTPKSQVVNNTNFPIFDRDTTTPKGDTGRPGMVLAALRGKPNAHPDCTSSKKCC